MFPPCAPTRNPKVNKNFWTDSLALYLPPYSNKAAVVLNTKQVRQNKMVKRIDGAVAPLKPLQDIGQQVYYQVPKRRVWLNIRRHTVPKVNI